MSDTLEEEIAWWYDRANKMKGDGWLLAFGVVVGLKFAREYYDAKSIRQGREDAGV